MYKRIMQHCFGRPGTGGPVVAFERLLANSAFSYGQIRQTESCGGFNLSLIRRFVSEIRAYGPELIHVRGLGNEGFHAVLAARIARVPYILVSVHGTWRDLDAPKNRLRCWIVTHILERLTLVMASHVATVCEFAAQRSFLVPYRQKLVGTVPNGAVILSAIRRDTGDLRAQWGIPQGWPLAICVSRITEEKGYSVLAQALVSLDKMCCNLGVLIVGGGDEDGRIRSRFDGLKHILVVFVGHQHDVGKFLGASDFFLFPSLHENLSNALIEAMSHGLPVIATSVGGNTEVVTKGGGLLVPAGDSGALADAINIFLGNLEAVKDMGREAREVVRQHYSLQQMVTGWEKIYLRILGGGHGIE